MAIFVFLATKSRGEFPPHIIWNEILTMFSPQVFEDFCSHWDNFSRQSWKSPHRACSQAKTFMTGNSHKIWLREVKRLPLLWSSDKIIEIYWSSELKESNVYKQYRERWHQQKYFCTRFEPRSHFKSRLSLIVRVKVVLKRTVVVDSDWRFDNLCGTWDYGIILRLLI